MALTMHIFLVKRVSRAAAFRRGMTEKSHEYEFCLCMIKYSAIMQI